MAYKQPRAPEDLVHFLTIELRIGKDGAINQTSGPISHLPETCWHELPLKTLQAKKPGACVSF
jgi:hypothetical protein